MESQHSDAAVSCDANGNPTFGEPIPTGIAVSAPSGDGFSPARVTDISHEPDGAVQLGMTAPLPLLTNQWAIEASGNLTDWVTLTNMTGLQFTSAYVDHLSSTNRFYRVESQR